MMCSAAAEHDVPYGYDARLRLMMCASRMCGTHRIIATKGSGIIFAERQKHHLPDRANIIHFCDVWLAFVLLAVICDKKPTEIRASLSLPQPVFIDCPLERLASAPFFILSISDMIQAIHAGMNIYF